MTLPSEICMSEASVVEIPVPINSTAIKMFMNFMMSYFLMNILLLKNYCPEISRTSSPVSAFHNLKLLSEPEVAR